LTHPEAFQVAFGAVGFGAVGLAVLAFSWTWAQDRDDYGSAHWQTKRELKANGMLEAPGTGFVCGKLGKPRAQAPFISASDIPHVMMVAPTRAGKGVGFVIPNLLSFAGSVVVLDVKGENFEKTARLRALKPVRLGQQHASLQSAGPNCRRAEFCAAVHRGLDPG